MGEADYYDTDDLRLIRGGITLRRRRGGDDAGWHLKLPLTLVDRSGESLAEVVADRRMRRARRAPAGQPAEVALHEARKAAKRARYAGEAISPVITGASRFANQMKKVQSVLGDHQDTIIARQAERELGIGAHLAGENAFSYGLLYGQDACEGEGLAAQARRTWERASRPRYRRWMS
jgi:hypothetical protein